MTETQTHIALAIDYKRDDAEKLWRRADACITRLTEAAGCRVGWAIATQTGLPRTGGVERWPTMADVNGLDPQSWLSNMTRAVGEQASLLGRWVAGWRGTFSRLNVEPETIDVRREYMDLDAPLPPAMHDIAHRIAAWGTTRVMGTTFDPRRALMLRDRIGLYGSSMPIICWMRRDTDHRDRMRRLWASYLEHTGELWLPCMTVDVSVTEIWKGSGAGKVHEFSSLVSILTGLREAGVMHVSLTIGARGLEERSLAEMEAWR